MSVKLGVTRLDVDMESWKAPVLLLCWSFRPPLCIDRLKPPAPLLCWSCCSPLFIESLNAICVASRQELMPYMASFLLISFSACGVISPLESAALRSVSSMFSELYVCPSQVMTPSSGR